MNKEEYYLTFILIIGIDFILLTNIPELFSYTYLSYIILGTLFIIVALIAKLIIQFSKKYSLRKLKKAGGFCGFLI